MKTRNYIAKKYFGKSFSKLNLNQCAMVNTARTSGIKTVFKRKDIIKLKKL